MKVLFIQKIVAVSGSEQYYLQLLPKLQSEGVECCFLGLLPSIDSLDENLSEFVSDLKNNGVDVHFIKVPNRVISISAVIKLVKFIKKEDFDIVQSNLIHADVYVAFARLIGRVKSKLVSTYHSFDSKSYQRLFGFDNVEYRNLFYYMACFSQRFFDHTIVISDGLKHLLLQKGLQKPTRLTRIHYGFDFKTKKLGLEKTYRRSANQLLMVGRLVPVKMHLAIISILRELASEIKDLSLVIVGDGPYREALESAVLDYSVADIVFFEGFRKNVHNYYAYSDLNLVLSKAEGFGVVILEAFQYECPVLAWDAPAMNEIIVHGKSGFLVEKYDLEKLRETIVHYFSCKDDLKKIISVNAKNRLHAYFSVDRMADETLSLYLSLSSCAK